VTYDYDLFTIGAGSGGVRASRWAAALGARVGIAEDRFLGGTCVNVGCVPKKLFVYAAHVPDEVKDAAGLGWTVGSPTLSWDVLKGNKDAEIHRLNGIYGRVLKGAGVTLHEGRARLTAPHTLEITAADGRTETVTAEHILVATGGYAVRPTAPGTERAWISDDVFEMEAVPKRIIVVGGGYIALEMAGIFHGLGSRTTLVYRGPHPLRGFDDDARFFLLEEIRKKGIDCRLNTKVECLEDGPDGDITAVLSHEETLDVDAVLYAIGRRPNTGGLGLEEVGVELDQRGAIVVDERYRTSAPNVYALGDVTDKVQLTPVAIAEGMALAEDLFKDGQRSVDYESIPTAVFSSPPLATCGLTEPEARIKYGKLDVYTSEFRPLKHTMTGSTERTFMKMIVDAASDRVVGVHIVGADGPEIIQGIAVAMKCGATKAQFDATIGLHPTAAEELVTMRDRRPDE
jgi:glutathione reductase (NADPH)